MIDHAALFGDILAVARTARSATGGWRTMCVRARRTLGRNVISLIADLDLDDAVPPLESRVRKLAAGAPREIDTLVFAFFDSVEDAGLVSMLRMSGFAEFDRSQRWLPRTASWTPDDAFLCCPALDTIARATRPPGTPRDTKRAVGNELRFGAAALLARFASASLRFTVVVAFDDGDYAVVASDDATAVRPDERQ